VALYCIRESAWVMGYAVTLWEEHDHQLRRYVRTLEVTAGLLRQQVNQEKNRDDGTVHNVTVG
jgi:uncharacterized membrane protein YdbT with pleckstrin-like domain